MDEKNTELEGLKINAETYRTSIKRMEATGDPRFAKTIGGEKKNLAEIEKRIAEIEKKK